MTSWRRLFSDSVRVASGDVLIGAGTVLTAEAVDRLHDLGGRLLVTPNVDPDVLARARERGLVTMPGVFTPTEAGGMGAGGAFLIGALRGRLTRADIRRSLLQATRTAAAVFTVLIGALLFCVVPVAGPGFLLLAWLPGGSSRTWFRVACRICLLLHLAAMNALVLLTMYGRR